jgi:hypothetical protein
MADQPDIRRCVPRTDALHADLRLTKALRELGTVRVKEAVRTRVEAEAQRCT